MTDATTTAAFALREATGALTAGLRARGTGSRIDSSEAPELASAIAQHLDAMTALLESVDLEPVPVTNAEPALRAIGQHLRQAAELAHHTATGDVPPYGPAPHATPDRGPRTAGASPP